MPDKMHGIEDPEIKQRQRYVDLIGSSLAVEHEGLTTREVFETRAKIISSMRRYLEDHGYVEVETPMLTPKATGAAAKPFKTHHNALDIDLYARIAPELYLKRLVVGGFEKVYELNRNFRNEGISYKHNPEFTMLEFYCAYMDVEGMMNFCEELMRQSVQKATGGLVVKVKQTRGSEPLVVQNYLGSRSEPRLSQVLVSEEVINVYDNQIDFSDFRRLTMKQAIAGQVKFAHEFIDGDFGAWLDSGANARILEQFLWWTENVLPDEVMIVHGDEPVMQLSTEEVNELIRKKWADLVVANAGANLTDEENGMAILNLFENFVEETLIQPTFIVDYPKSISPLSKASPENRDIAERFELFINGMEVANGFSELNDPKEQYERFVDQMSERERGDEEAMILDEDYIRALSYGMPPAAGIGIGIDRLVMLLTNKHSIRDVILFPHMRPERSGEQEEEN
jgi:lysyl-tRNA synthetase, class II